MRRCSAAAARNAGGTLLGAFATDIGDLSAQVILLRELRRRRTPLADARQRHADGRR
jgi:hypothetical protein